MQLPSRQQSSPSVHASTSAGAHVDIQSESDSCCWHAVGKHGHVTTPAVGPEKVTAPVCASRRPVTLTLSLTVMLTWARKSPTTLLKSSSVTELPTDQNTEQGDAPLRRTILAGATDDAISVEPIWK